MFFASNIFRSMQYIVYYNLCICHIRFYSLLLIIWLSKWKQVKYRLNFVGHYIKPIQWLTFQFQVSIVFLQLVVLVGPILATLVCRLTHGRILQLAPCEFVLALYFNHGAVLQAYFSSVLNPKNCSSTNDE